MLRKVILHCYKYHDCEYLLDFSGQLMHRRAQSIDSIVIVDNGNGTRSLKNITNNRVGDNSLNMELKTYFLESHKIKKISE